MPWKCASTDLLLVTCAAHFFRPFRIFHTGVVSLLWNKPNTPIISQENVPQFCPLASVMVPFHKWGSFLKEEFWVFCVKLTSKHDQHNYSVRVNKDRKIIIKLYYKIKGKENVNQITNNLKLLFKCMKIIIKLKQTFENTAL